MEAFVRTAVVFALSASVVSAQAPGTVVADQELVLPVPVGIGLGVAVCSLGDIDGNGVEDLAVANDGSVGRVFVLTRNADGSIATQVEIGEGLGGFTGDLAANDEFGCSLAAIGDLDGNGVTELAVGACGDDDGIVNGGALWILFLNPDGTVSGHQKVSATEGNFPFLFSSFADFPRGMAPAGDVDGNGTPDLWVSAPNLNGGTLIRVQLAADGTVLAATKIDKDNGFGGDPGVAAGFGQSLAALGDVNGDGIGDLAAGARGDGILGFDPGAVWVLLLGPGGTIASERRSTILSETTFADTFAISVAAPGDVDGDGIVDVVVGARTDDDGSDGAGALWVLFLERDGSVRAEQKISATEGGLVGPLAAGALFGCSLAVGGDLDGNGVRDLYVGACNPSGGALWQLELAGLVGPVGVPYGCEAPRGSLLLVEAPSIGSDLVVGVDNPTGTQGAGSFPFLSLSLAPDPAFPCGTPLAAASMFGSGAGELLVGLGAGQFVLLIPGPTWAGPGQPVTFTVPVPANPALVGRDVFVQGLLVDPSAPPAALLGLSEGQRVVIGP